MSDTVKDYANRLLESSEGNGRTVMSERQAWAIARRAVDEQLGDDYINGLVDRHLSREETSKVVGEFIGKKGK